jgi:SAM-dependent methyltransferase
MIADVDTARATSFGAWADDYHDWTPTYPDVAVDWLVPPDGSHVAEIGAGTGKLTDRLVERGLEVDVVEPDGRMLGIISQRHPRLRTYETGATSLPLSDSSVDAALVADAWHWFPKRGSRCGGGPRAPAQRLAWLRVERPCAAARVGVAGAQA